LQSYSKSLIDLKLFGVSLDGKLFGILLFGFPSDLNLIYNVCLISKPFSQLQISLCIQILNWNQCVLCLEAWITDLSVWNQLSPKDLNWKFTPYLKFWFNFLINLQLFLFSYLFHKRILSDICQPLVSIQLITLVSFILQSICCILCPAHRWHPPPWIILPQIYLLTKEPLHTASNSF